MTLTSLCPNRSSIPLFSAVRTNRKKTDKVNPIGGDGFTSLLIPGDGMSTTLVCSSNDTDWNDSDGVITIV